MSHPASSTFSWMAAMMLTIGFYLMSINEGVNRSKAYYIITIFFLDFLHGRKKDSSLASSSTGIDGNRIMHTSHLSLAVIPPALLILGKRQLLLKELHKILQL